MPNMPLDQFGHEAVKGASHCGGLLQDRIAVRASFYGTFNSFNLPPNSAHSRQDLFIGITADMSHWILYSSIVNHSYDEGCSPIALGIIAETLAAPQSARDPK